MKKALAALLAVIWVFSLSACGENGENPSDDVNISDISQSESQNVGITLDRENTASAPGLDFSAIMAGNGAADTVWGKEDAATKQQLIAEGKKDGVDAMSLS